MIFKLVLAVDESRTFLEYKKSLISGSRTGTLSTYGLTRQSKYTCVSLTQTVLTLQKQNDGSRNLSDSLHPVCFLIQSLSLPECALHIWYTAVHFELHITISLENYCLFPLFIFCFLYPFFSMFSFMRKGYIRGKYCDTLHIGKQT